MTGVRAGLLAFIVFAFSSLIWPTSRAFLDIKIDDNEGWNAFFADAAMGRRPLYPAPEEFITNNYPPLSFYVVGWAGQFVGDPILAGRLISLGSVIGIGLLIAGILREMNCTGPASIAGGAWFVGTLGFFCSNYVGMNDPQLLAQMLMTAGFLVFLRSIRLGQGYWLPILMIVTAGFFKHNIITLPFGVFVWMAFEKKWKPLKVCFGWALLSMGTGFATCALIFGKPFFNNLLSPRMFTWTHEWEAFQDLTFTGILLPAWLIAAFQFRSSERCRLLNLLVVTGTAVHFLQRTGEGVDVNSCFDLLIVLGICAGFLFDRFGQNHGTTAGSIFQMGFLAAIFIQFLSSETRFDFLKLRDPEFQAEIAQRKAAVIKSVTNIQSVPGPVECDAYLCYRAGKPFIVDTFNLKQRIRTGKLSEPAVREELRKSSVTRVEPDPDFEW